MDKYRLQLEQINASLAANPNDIKLILLKEKLEELLKLKSTLANQSVLPSEKSHSNPHEMPLTIGEACEVFLEDIGQWRPAHVMSITAEKKHYIAQLDSTDGKVLRVSCNQARRPRPKVSKTKSLKKASKPAPKPRNRSSGPVPEGLNEWKKFSEKMKKSN